MPPGEYKIERTQFGPLLLKIVYSHFCFLWTKLLQQQKEYGCCLLRPFLSLPLFLYAGDGPQCFLLAAVCCTFPHRVHGYLSLSTYISAYRCFFFIFPLIYQSYFFWYTYICKVQVSFTTVIGSVTFLCNFHACRQLVDHRKSNLSTGLRSSCFLNVSLAPEFT